MIVRSIISITTADVVFVFVVMIAIILIIVIIVVFVSGYNLVIDDNR